jgi:hypothetical protein
VPDRTDPLLRSIAEALWSVGQGYTVEDIGDRSVDWCPENPDDVADEAMHMGHARKVLEHLTAAGWEDHGAQMDAHRQGALDALDALIEAVEDGSKTSLDVGSVLALLRGSRAIVQMEGRRHA